MKEAGNYRWIAASVLLLIITGVGGWRSLQRHSTTSAGIAKSGGGTDTSIPMVSQQPILPDHVIEPYADSAVVLDAASGKVLVAKNERAAVPIASTTKIMSSIVLLRSGRNLDDEVEVSSEAASQIGSTMGLAPGEHLTLRQLLTGALLVSGNDAIYAIAQQIGGVDAFVAKMNETASDIGLDDSHFLDPAGLNDDGHSSAFDLAMLFRYALTFPDFRTIVNTADATIASQEGDTFHLVNSDRLVHPNEALFFPGTIGGKTGFTPAAGHTLVTAASNSGHLLVVVVLHTDENTNDASASEANRLLSWAFDRVTWAAK